MIYGLDTLLLPHYGNVAINNWPDGFACGSFAVEGGDAYPWIDKLLATGKCPAVRMQLLWSHNNHLFSDADIPNITHLSQRYEQLALKYPDKKIWLSPFCEAQNIHNPDKYLDIVAKNAPHCTPIWCPINGVWSQKYANETHGGGPQLSGTHIRSGDGGINNHDDLDLDITLQKNNHAACDIFMVWISHFNGHFSMNQPQQPIDQRTGWPTLKEIQAAAMLATDRGTVSVPKGFAVKSNSEDHSATDTKGDKLCIISPIQSHNKTIALRLRNGTLVDSLTFFGSYSAGGWRYYSNHMGVEVAELAIRGQGDALLNLFIDGVQHAVVNPAFYVSNL